MIRVEAGMPTTRFCQIIGMPERTWRRWQARLRDGTTTKGPSGPARHARACAPPRVATLWRTRPGVTGRCGRWSVTMAMPVRRRLCRGCCATRGSFCRPRISGNVVSARSGARPCSRRNRAARTRSGSWTSPSLRPPPVAPGGSLDAGTTGRSTSIPGMSRRARTSTTRSPRSRLHWRATRRCSRAR